MTRHELREAIFKTIFQIPFYGDDLPEIDLEDDYKVTDDDKAYVDYKVSEIRNHLTEIDDEINKCSKGWKTKRIGKAELAILRVAIYEIKFDPDIPDKVAINEALELAKIYCDDKAKNFINGVLAGVCKTEA